MCSAILDEDIRAFIRAYEKMIKKSGTFFENIDGERVLSVFTVLISITCKVKKLTKKS